MSGNISITESEIAAIKALEPFDLTMLLSEIHDHGWPAARELLPMILEAQAKIAERAARAKGSAE